MAAGEGEEEGRVAAGEGEEEGRVAPGEGGRVGTEVVSLSLAVPRIDLIRLDCLY